MNVPSGQLVQLRYHVLDLSDMYLIGALNIGTARDFIGTLHCLHSSKSAAARFINEKFPQCLPIVLQFNTT